MPDMFEDLAVLPACLEDISILQRDPEFLLINKPTRLLSVPGRHPKNRDSVITRLLVDFPTAAIVHRLDFDTSGIMVIPLNKKSLSHISKQFQNRSTQKTYTAVVDGIIEKNNGVIDLPIASDMENRPKYKICTETGRQSVTEFTVVSRDEIAQTSRVLLHPITGRSHQLRLHMKAIGHPILGCEFYADEVALKKSSRLLLHATELEFDHPVIVKRIKGYCEPRF
ncbi:MAG: RNA pseudouridine synthase [Gammaproteobacteria bacterium]|nr:MAG: RNA pseudouridine synthase [Gammaproteobacteria bacterium]